MRVFREPEKVIRDGKVAVLVSKGFGAGWSTWASYKEQAMLCLFDRRFVEAVEASVTDIEKIASEFLGSGFYCGGWRDVCIEWVPVGTEFTVREYDGSEKLAFRSDNDYPFKA